MVVSTKGRYLIASTAATSACKEAGVELSPHVLDKAMKATKNSKGSKKRSVIRAAVNAAVNALKEIDTAQVQNLDLNTLSEHVSTDTLIAANDIPDIVSTLGRPGVWLLMSVLVLFSLIIIVFCITMLAQKRDPVVYIPLLTFVIGAWFPSPLSLGKKPQQT